jgi:hypothetical protein
MDGLDDTPAGSLHQSSAPECICRHETRLALGGRLVAPWFLVPFLTSKAMEAEVDGAGRDGGLGGCLGVRPGQRHSETVSCGGVTYWSGSTARFHFLADDPRWAATGCAMLWPVSTR